MTVTGVDSRKDNIIELGAVKFSLAENSASFDSLFHSPTRIPQFVERLTGIQNSDLDGAPQFAEKKSEIENFVGDSVVVGHNLPFDLDFLKSAGADFADRKTLDTFLLAGLILPRGESLGLENLAQKFQIAHTDAHRALADAAATRDLLRVFVGLAKNFPAEKWEKIRALDAEKNWVQLFAELVVDSEIAKREFENSPSENLKIRESVVEKLSAEFSGAPKLLEVAATPAEIFAAAKKIDSPSALFFGSNFVVREILSGIPASAGTGIFAPRDLVDAEKLEKFLAKKLTPTELSLAAKLILHSEKSRPELNLTRAENLIFDCVVAEKISENSAAKILVGDHSAREFAESDRTKIVVDAASFAENRVRANSVVVDLPNLELLAPDSAEKIQIWWGLLGLLFREAAPRFGRLDFAAAGGLPSFSKTVDAGRNLLAEISDSLPPPVATALRNFLDPDSDFTKILRQNQLGEITLVVEPRNFPPLDFSQNFLVDGALDAADNFNFAKKMFALDRDFPAEKSCPRGGGDSVENAPRIFRRRKFSRPRRADIFSRGAKIFAPKFAEFRRADGGHFSESRGGGEFRGAGDRGIGAPDFRAQNSDDRKIGCARKSGRRFFARQFSPARRISKSRRRKIAVHRPRRRGFFRGNAARDDAPFQKNLVGIRRRGVRGTIFRARPATRFEKIRPKFASTRFRKNSNQLKSRSDENFFPPPEAGSTFFADFAPDFRQNFSPAAATRTSRVARFSRAKKRSCSKN